MSKNYEDYKPLNPLPPRKRKNPAISFIKYSIVFLLILALSITVVLFVISHKNDQEGGTQNMGQMTLDTWAQTDSQPEDTTDGTQTSEQTPEVNIPVEEGIDFSKYSTIELDKSAINDGSLIFISPNYKAVYPTEEELVKIADKKTKDYQLSSNTMLINKDVMIDMNVMFADFVIATKKDDLIIWTAYRDEARQKKVYDDYVKAHGEAEANKNVSKPGESDHHTGYSIAVNVYRDKKKYTLDEFEGYSWLEENCYKYGFVERYPENKVDKTGMTYTTALYLRYVGVPHAEVMKKNDLCLEEYLVLLKDYEFGKKHYDYKAENGTEYEFYYVSGETATDKIMVSVPVDKKYTVSGNNMDGFIVTVTK